MYDVYLFVFQFLLGLLVYGIFGHTFFMPWLKKVPRYHALILLATPHAFRFLALSGYEQAYYNPEITMAWARPTAISDFASAVTAIIAMIALTRNSRLSIALVWVCNLAGIYAFLVTAGGMVIHHVAVHLLFAGWFMAVFWVPVLIWSHILLTQELLGKRSLTAG